MEGLLERLTIGVDGLLVEELKSILESPLCNEEQQSCKERQRKRPQMVMEGTLGWKVVGPFAWSALSKISSHAQLYKQDNDALLESLGMVAWMCCRVLCQIESKLTVRPLDLDKLLCNTASKFLDVKQLNWSCQLFCLLYNRLQAFTTSPRSNKSKAKTTKIGKVAPLNFGNLTASKDFMCRAPLLRNILYGEDHGLVMLIVNLQISWIRLHMMHTGRDLDAVRDAILASGGLLTWFEQLSTQVASKFLGIFAHHWRASLVSLADGNGTILERCLSVEIEFWPIIQAQIGSCPDQSIFELQSKSLYQYLLMGKATLMRGLLRVICDTHHPHLLENRHASIAYQKLLDLPWDNLEAFIEDDCLDQMVDGRALRILAAFRSTKIDMGPFPPSPPILCSDFSNLFWKEFVKFLSKRPLDHLPILIAGTSFACLLQCPSSPQDCQEKGLIVLFKVLASAECSKMTLQESLLLVAERILREAVTCPDTLVDLFVAAAYSQGQHEGGLVCAIDLLLKLDQTRHAHSKEKSVLLYETLSSLYLRIRKPEESLSWLGKAIEIANDHQEGGGPLVSDTLARLARKWCRSFTSLPQDFKEHLALPKSTAFLYTLIAFIASSSEQRLTGLLSLIRNHGNPDDYMALLLHGTFLTRWTADQLAAYELDAQSRASIKTGPFQLSFLLLGQIWRYLSKKDIENLPIDLLCSPLSTAITGHPDRRMAYENVLKIGIHLLSLLGFFKEANAIIVYLLSHTVAPIETQLIEISLLQSDYEKTFALIERMQLDDREKSILQRRVIIESDPKQSHHFLSQQLYMGDDWFLMVQDCLSYSMHYYLDGWWAKSFQFASRALNILLDRLKRGGREGCDEWSKYSSLFCTLLWIQHLSQLAGNFKLCKHFNKTGLFYAEMVRSKYWQLAFLQNRAKLYKEAGLWKEAEEDNERIQRLTDQIGERERPYYGEGSVWRRNERIEERLVVFKQATSADTITIYGLRESLVEGVSQELIELLEDSFLQASCSQFRCMLGLALCKVDKLLNGACIAAGLMECCKRLAGIRRIEYSRSTNALGEEMMILPPKRSRPFLLQMMANLGATIQQTSIPSLSIFFEPSLRMIAAMRHDAWISIEPRTVWMVRSLPKDCDGLVDRLRQLQVRNKHSLLPPANLDEAGAKRSWWRARYELETDLRNLLQCMRDQLLGPMFAFFFSVYRGDGGKEGIARALLHHRHSDPSNHLDPQKLLLLLQRASMQKIESTSFLSAVGLCGDDVRDFEGLVKQEFQSKLEQEENPFVPTISTPTNQALILFLDWFSQELPWEITPGFENISMIRALADTWPVISLPVLPATLQIGQIAALLNPSGDLRRTEHFLSPILAKMDLDVERQLIGTAPTTHQMTSLLSQSDLLLYFGHSAGEMYISQDDLMAKDRCSSLFLFGCSSARLLRWGGSVPEGPLLTYANAKCPLAVGNLWDVTDRDIDKLAVHFLTALNLIDRSLPINLDPVHITTTLNGSRSACLLKLLNGGAPVLYLNMK